MLELTQAYPSSADPRLTRDMSSSTRSSRTKHTTFLANWAPTRAPNRDSARGTERECLQRRLIIHKIAAVACDICG